MPKFHIYRETEVPLLGAETVTHVTRITHLGYDDLAEAKYVLRRLKNIGSSFSSRHFIAQDEAPVLRVIGG
jgi:hypothetical protein